MNKKIPFVIIAMVIMVLSLSVGKNDVSNVKEYVPTTETTVSRDIPNDEIDIEIATSEMVTPSYEGNKNRTDEEDLVKVEVITDRDDIEESVQEKSESEPSISFEIDVIEHDEFVEKSDTQNNSESDETKETVGEQEKPKEYVENTEPDNNKQFELSGVPEYKDRSYVEINNNTPFFTDISTEEFEIYSPLDELGRCGVAFANISPETIPSEKRGEIGSVRPSGWHTVKYNDLIDGNYLYNRCHLIAYELAGENANPMNLITGTRYLNVQGLLYFENRVADYVNYTSNHVLYRCTPVFEGDNLVATGVLIEAYSVEDEGKGICFCVFCYNVQPGVVIDYATGESWRADEDVSTASEITSLPEQKKVDERNIVDDNADNQSVDNLCDYVANKNTKKFHYPTCSSVGDMKEKNKMYFYGNRDELINHVPCKRCNP